MIILLAIATFLLLVMAAIVTNPFSRFTIVRKPYMAQLARRSIELRDNSDRIIVRNHVWWRWFAWFKAGVHMQETRYIRSPRSKSKTIKGIIADIHTLRYDTSKLLLISGDHFSPLFVRNLGVFYYPMLDTNIPATVREWNDRQIVYLETTAFALGVFAKTSELTTTITSTMAHGVTCLNFYAYPSDTLHGMLYGLATLSGKVTPRHHDYAKSDLELTTIRTAEKLLLKHHKNLKAHYERYRDTVFDSTTQLIKTDIHLSGAKDITRRYSAFYDNVIFWRTTQLAMTLGIIPEDKSYLRQLKRAIITRFWLPHEGHFLEDLSEEGVENQYYSSDWLVILFTGFLDPTKPSDQQYFIKNIEYIDKHGIDKPFAIKYQQDRRAHRQFFTLRLLQTSSYGGDSIWSFWGMEYIKTLLLLYQSTGQSVYLKKADRHIAAYKKAMLRDAGFPEVYDKDGNLLQTPFYRSIRMTGWVIGFEQVLAMRASIER